MPELPEVETVRRVLELWVKNKRISDTHLYYSRVLEDIEFTLFKEKIINQKINDVQRIGKYLLFMLDDYVLVSHLRMEGKYYLIKDNILDEKMDKYKIIDFSLDDGSTLLYNDVRKFGKMKLLKKDEYLKDVSLKKLGKEPFYISKEELFEKIKNSNKPIKELILDQSVMSGLGNIYADEVLYACKINPLRKGKNLNMEECSLIIEKSIVVLNKAIELGGSTIRSYHSGNKVDGRFQNELKVYGKKGEKCENCASLIEKTVVGGRGTHYCPNCQKY